MADFTEPKAFIAAAAKRLTDDHGHSEDEALAIARTRYPDLTHTEDGRMFVRLSTGVRVRADDGALQLVTRELASSVAASARAADIEELKREKRASGDYRL